MADNTDQLAVVDQLPPAPGSNEGTPGVLSRVIVTSNTKLAATYLTFGYQLRRHDPLYWIDHYMGEDIERHGYNRARFVSKCFFNLEPQKQSAVESARAISSAFVTTLGQRMLMEFVNGLTQLTPAEKHQLLFLCSVVVAEGCREVQEKREFLVKQINEMPEAAKWVRVWQDGRSVTFGRNASLETRAQMLAKLGINPHANNHRRS
jgi:hypothetical protein